ncbi:Endonuclease/exonuclease/phosphatase, partial [Thelephora terrestris]
KWFHVPQIIRENGIGILAVQETHLTDELAEQFHTLFDSRLVLHHSPDPETRNAKGIALILNKRMVKTDQATTTVIVPGRAITLTLPWQENERINILAVYSPNAQAEIREFWKTINAKLETNPTLKPDIVLGDFNLVEDAIDRIPCRGDDAQTVQTLREFKIKHNLTDGWRKANPTEKAYSWTRLSDGTQSRIDRIYVKEEMFPDCSDWAIAMPPIPTDHDMILAKVTTPTTPKLGRGRWAIPTRTLKNKKIKSEIQTLGLSLQRKIELSQQTRLNYKPQQLLKDFKTEVREIIRTYEKKTQPMIKKRIENLSKKLQEILN